MTGLSFLSCSLFPPTARRRQHARRGCRARPRRGLYLVNASRVNGGGTSVTNGFFSGIVFNAASAALFLYTKGHGSSIFRDSKRLVLVLFLLSAALWAQIDFVTVLLDVSRSSMSCQVGVAFATVFDQLARFSIEQYLVWAMNHGKPTVVQMIPQFLVLGRFIAGAVFAGFTRPQTDTFCVAASSAFPVAVVVIILDVVILLALTVKAFSSLPDTGILNKESDLAKRVSHKLILAGAAIWTAVGDSAAVHSVPELTP